MKIFFKQTLLVITILYSQTHLHAKNIANYEACQYIEPPQPNTPPHKLSQEANKAIDTFIHAIFFGYKEFTKKNLQPLELWTECYHLSRVLFDARGLLPSVLGRSLARKLKNWEDEQIAQDKSANLVHYAAVLSVAFMAKRIANLVHTLDDATMSIKSRSFKAWSRGRTLYYVSSEINSKAGIARQGIYTLVALPDETGRPRLFLRDFTIDRVSILESLSRHSRDLREQAQGDFRVFLLLLLSTCQPIIPLLDKKSRHQLHKLEKKLQNQLTPEGQAILHKLNNNEKGS